MNIFTKKHLYFPIIALIGMLFAASMFMSRTATAVDSSAVGFDAGNIIEDYVLTNKDSMSVPQIQNFLNGKVASCDTYGTQPSEFGGGTRAQWAANQSLHPNIPAFYPPFTCLKDYSQNGLSAAQIIYNVAQSYNINPQVLIVVLQKEQGLVTDTWPGPHQYKTATGYGCPDTAACDSQYFGFTNQLTNTARMFHAIEIASPTWYTPYILGNNTIQYNPNASCGSSTVNIQNRATQALYNYTPYQPNDATLNAPMGTTVSCGAYGNLNFYRYFTQWFGSTHGRFTIDTAAAQQAVTDTYNQYSGQLGSATTDLNFEYNTDGRVWQSFQNGTIIWTQTYGAHPVFNGAILNRWKALGGSLGSLGVPVNAQTQESDGRIWQSFASGVVIYTASTGAWEVFPGPLGDAWRASGGSLGFLGVPTSGVVISSESRKQSFANGIVIRKNASSPAYVIAGDIYQAWNSTPSAFGMPTTSPVTESGDGRIWQNFEKGTFIDSGSAAYFVSYGTLFNKWKGLGGSTGSLGKPTSDTTTESDGRIWQSFDSGYIIQKNKDSPAVNISYGALFNRWKDLGGSTGSLGVPIGPTTTESDGRIWQVFEGGYIIYSSSTGAWEIEGNFFTYWKQHGGSTGVLGKPTGAKQIESNGTRWQQFEHGKITWSSTSGWSISS